MVAVLVASLMPTLEGLADKLNCDKEIIKMAHFYEAISLAQKESRMISGPITGDQLKSKTEELEVEIARYQKTGDIERAIDVTRRMATYAWTYGWINTFLTKSRFQEFKLVMAGSVDEEKAEEIERGVSESLAASQTMVFKCEQILKNL